MRAHPRPAIRSQDAPVASAPSLAHFPCIIEDQRQAVAIDPRRDVDEAVRHLIRMGYDHFGGYLAGGMRCWYQHGARTVTTGTITARSCAARWMQARARAFSMCTAKRNGRSRGAWRRRSTCGSPSFPVAGKKSPGRDRAPSLRFFFAPDFFRFAPARAAAALRL